MLLKKLVLGLACLCAVTITGVAHAGEKVMYQEVTDNKPDVGVSTTVYLGDRMLEQRHGQYADCVVPKFNYEKSMNLGVGRFIVKSGEPLCKASINSKYYSPSYVNWLGGTDVKLQYDTTLVDKGDGFINICMTSMGAKAGCTKDKVASDYERGPWFLYSKNTIQQVIEYSGKSGGILKFVYSEFFDGYARQAFTREFQVDLSEGKIAAYKGAIIEIETATNSSITYKVVRNFQQ